MEKESSHFTITYGDFNAKIDLKTDSMETALRNFETEGKNERGKQLLEFLLENGQY